MKKLLSMLCALCALCCTACSDDDETEGGISLNDIAGTYLVIAVDGQTIIYDAGYEPTFSIKPSGDIGGKVSFENIPMLSGSKYFKFTPTVDGYIKDATIHWEETYYSTNDHKNHTMEYHADFSSYKRGEVLYWNSRGDKYTIKCKKL